MAGDRKRSGVRSRDSFPKMAGGAHWLPESDLAEAAGTRVRVRARIRVEEEQSDGDSDRLFKRSKNRSIEKLEANRDDTGSECQSD